MHCEHERADLSLWVGVVACVINTRILLVANRANLFFTPDVFPSRGPFTRRCYFVGGEVLSWDSGKGQLQIFFCVR